MSLCSQKYCLLCYKFTDDDDSLFVLSKDFSQAEKNRYDKMLAFLQRIGNAPPPEIQGMPVMKSLTSFHISYRFPKCPEKQVITGKCLVWARHFINSTNVVPHANRQFKYNKIYTE